jgi:hypothetical protein
MPTRSDAIRIFRKFVSNLKIREEVLRSHGDAADYSVGPTLIWTEDSADLAMFTSNEGYSNFISFESPHDDPRSKHYLAKVLRRQKNTKGSILIKEASSPQNKPTSILVHFCAYFVDASGMLHIFDPSWHSADPGIYSTTAFYESLDAFRIPYQHVEPHRPHHWQSLLSNDVFCQTWTLEWLRKDCPDHFPLPETAKEAASHVSNYIHEFVKTVNLHREKYVSLFPKHKWEGFSPNSVLDKVCSVSISHLE